MFGSFDFWALVKRFYAERYSIFASYFCVLEAWLTPHTIPGPSGKCSSISFFLTHQYYVSLKQPLRCNQTRATESTKGSGDLVGHYTHTFDSTLVQDIPVTADTLLTLIYVLILFSSDNCSGRGLNQGPYDIKSQHLTHRANGPIIA